MRRLPPLRALEAFIRVVRLGSARSAANELGLSPSALSRRIATLEEFIGKKLFTRARQAMQLTDEGAAFHEAVLPHFEALARAVEGQSESTSLLRLRLGVLPLFGTQRLFPRLGELRRLHPILHIDIDTGPHLEDRVGDTLDAAIILSNRPSAGLHAVRLDENKVHAITNAELAATLGDTPDAGLLARLESDLAKLRKLLLVMVDDPRVFLIKIADRLHNMRTMYAVNSAKSKFVANETLQVWCSFAEQLGMFGAKAEMEDLSFAVVNPDAFRAVINARVDEWYRPDDGKSSKKAKARTKTADEDDAASSDLSEVESDEPASDDDDASTSEAASKSAFTMTWEPPTGADVQMFFEKVLRGENAGTPRRHSPRGEKERAVEAERRARPWPSMSSSTWLGLG